MTNIDHTSTDAADPNRYETEQPDTQAVEEEDSLDEGELRTQLSGEISIEKGDRSLSEFKRWHDEGDLIVDPEWQRNYVWNNKQASKLIESFLLNIPVPVIYLAKTPSNQYEVIDGLQRLTSVFKFLENRFALTDLGLLDNLNKKRFRDLDRVHQRKLTNSILRSFELSSETNADIHFVVFERLNTGGTKLNEMEIRNCLFRGKLNDLIKELATDSDFVKCVNEKTLPKRMKDRTFVLRFLAFHERTHRKCKAGIKKFLNEFLDTYRNPPEQKLNEYQEVFRRCMKASITVFGSDGFRLKKESANSTSRSAGEWSTRSNVAIFQCVAPSFADYRLQDITKNSDRIYEEYLDLISADHKWVDYVRRATGEVSRLEYVFDEWQRRLRMIMNDDQNHGERIFSRQLKRELFDQNRTCRICENEIRLLDDAVLDHIEHYWRGGTTLPENARLTHRFCNLSRGGR